MVLYASVIPFEIGENIQLTLSQEIIKTSIYMTEIIFLYYSLKSKNNFAEDQAHLRVITVALGWSFTESLLNNLFYYLFNSMGEEFTWEYIRTAIMANVEMVEKMAIVALIQTGNKLREEKKDFAKFLKFLLIAIPIFSLIVGILAFYLVKAGVSEILTKGTCIISVIVAVIIGGFTLIITAKAIKYLAKMEFLQWLITSSKPEELKKKYCDTLVEL